ncbi:MAG: hypothetical protein JNK82_34895 [Myxococcaceae bacterium]|nr:hypothetical protein [Myxococcaceae bacterium]
MSLTEEQIARYARQILVVGGKGQAALCAAKARASPDSLVGRYLAAGGTELDPSGEPLCEACEAELGDHPLVALAFQRRVLTGRCPRHP